MSDVSKWLRKAFKDKNRLARSAEQPCSRAGFLDLPGEIRNQIYAYMIYPDLESVTLANCSKLEHFGACVLQLSIYRVSPQIRAEALSFLCATKVIKILGIGTANIFFDCIGAALSDVKSLTLVQPSSDIVAGCDKMISRFFGFVDEAKSLKNFHVEALGDTTTWKTGTEHVSFLKRAQDLGTGSDVEVQIRVEKTRW